MDDSEVRPSVGNLLPARRGALPGVWVIRGYVCGSTVTSVFTEFAMKHCSCAV